MLVDARRGECPFPPPGRVRLALERAYQGINRYPDPGMVRRLEEAYARYAGVPAESVAALPGSDTILERIVLAARPRAAGVYAGGFFHWTRLPQEYGLRVRVLGEPGGALDWGEVEALGRGSVALIDDPSNPLGARPLAGPPPEPPGPLVVVDEAYYEYAGSGLAEAAAGIPGLIVVRTLSKAFSLAGARVGFAVGEPGTLASLRLRGDPLPFRLSRPSIEAAMAALEDPGYMRRCVEYMTEWREWLAGRLEKLGYRVSRGQSPFILVQTGVSDAAERLREMSVLVAQMPASIYGPGAVRVSPADPPGNQRVVEAFERLSG